MAKPIEFDEFYSLLSAVKSGDRKKKKKLETLLIKYKNGEDAASAYDELGKIFCVVGSKSLYEYTGIDDLAFLGTLNQSVWDYLKVRMGCKLNQYIIDSMNSHAEKNKLAAAISKKWELSTEEITDNLAGLAEYITEGIVDIFP